MTDYTDYIHETPCSLWGLAPVIGLLDYHADSLILRNDDGSLWRLSMDPCTWTHHREDPEFPHPLDQPGPTGVIRSTGRLFPVSGSASESIPVAVLVSAAYEHPDAYDDDLDYLTLTIYRCQTTGHLMLLGVSGVMTMHGIMHFPTA